MPTHAAGPDIERRVTAWHEAAHVIAVLLSKHFGVGDPAIDVRQHGDRSPQYQRGSAGGAGRQAGVCRQRSVPARVQELDGQSAGALPPWQRALLVFMKKAGTASVP